MAISSPRPALDLPPNQLRTFLAVARRLSFTRAAEELSVTQGAVSHQVKALELQLGVKLFNRERQRLVITEAGREYLASARDVVAVSRTAPVPPLDTKLPSTPADPDALLTLAERWGLAGAAKRIVDALATP